jgi:hypothetical protein
VSTVQTTHQASPPVQVAPAQVAQPPGRTRGPFLDRVVVGVLLVAVGVAWQLDASGVPVPWRMFPAAALVLVGLALLVSLWAGSGRSGLVALGAALLLVALATGVGVTRFTGPAGERVLAPTVAQWPGTTQMSAGTVTVDLTRHPLPPSGRLDVRVGAGRIVVVLPQSPPRVDAAVVAGAITVDGVRVGDGLDVHWTEPTPAGEVAVVLEVGTGEVEVRHV